MNPCTNNFPCQCNYAILFINKIIINCCQVNVLNGHIPVCRRILVKFFMVWSNTYGPNTKSATYLWELILIVIIMYTNVHHKHLAQALFSFVFSLFSFLCPVKQLMIIQTHITRFRNSFCSNAVIN